MKLSMKLSIALYRLYIYISGAEDLGMMNLRM